MDAHGCTEKEALAMYDDAMREKSQYVTEGSLHKWDAVVARASLDGRLWMAEDWAGLAH